MGRLKVVIISPWNKICPFSFPLPKDDLLKVQMKLAHCFWKRKNSKIVNVFYYFAIISPWKRAWSFIWENLNPIYTGMLCAMFCWYQPCCSRGEDENGKSFQTDRSRRTDWPRTTGKETFYLLSAEVS